MLGSGVDGVVDLRYLTAPRCPAGCCGRVRRGQQRSAFRAMRCMANKSGTTHAGSEWDTRVDRLRSASASASHRERPAENKSRASCQVVGRHPHTHPSAATDRQRHARIRRTLGGQQGQSTRALSLAFPFSSLTFPSLRRTLLVVTRLDCDIPECRSASPRQSRSQRQVGCPFSCAGEN